jgi:hypothetical protein
MAMDQSQLAASGVAPDRLGVVFGTEMLQVEPDELVNAFRPCLDEGKFD